MQAPACLFINLADQCLIDRLARLYAATGDGHPPADNISKHQLIRKVCMREHRPKLTFTFRGKLWAGEVIRRVRPVLSGTDVQVRLPA